MAVIKKKGYVVSSNAGTHHMHFARCLELTLILSGCVYLTKRTADGPRCTVLGVNREVADLAITVKKKERKQSDHTDTEVRSTMSSDMLSLIVTGSRRRKRSGSRSKKGLEGRRTKRLESRRKKRLGSRRKKRSGSRTGNKRSESRTRQKRSGSRRKKKGLAS